ncbi:MAG: adenylate/guanylate cyclase domain-containing protein [Alphaproteobacteria bacterium]|nr:adenylate/guanylate cyclase domain-containing protein [Alphaproteobacteria bacterium]
MDRPFLRQEALPTLDLARLADWLVGAGLQGGQVADVLGEFCRRLNAAGLRLARAHVSMSTLHPLVRAYGYTWSRSTGSVEASEFEHSDEVSEAWRRSPFNHMIETSTTRMRRRLTGPDALLDYPVLAEFRAQGVTDWYAAIFDFGFRVDDRSASALGLVCSFSTDREGGFSETDITFLETILPMLALTIKSIVSIQISRSLLATYLGRDAAERVFLGQVRRGSVLSTDAVLLFADLQGFTTLADAMPTTELVSMLDDYLDAMTRPVEARGGQVLKFMGDGVLAVFALGTEGRAGTCRTALEAAVAAQQEVARLNRGRADAGQPGLVLDLALHVGEVLYGNVGSATRLDFTVIGPAVNEASRIEALCKELGRPVLVSEEFAEVALDCRDRLVSLGRHRLRGVSGERELFGLAPEGGTT